MNKTELIDSIAVDTGLTKAQSKAALESVLENISKALQHNDRVSLVGFGSFYTSERSAREGINPRTKEKIKISAKKVAKFKAGSELEDSINTKKGKK